MTTWFYWSTEQGFVRILLYIVVTMLCSLIIMSIYQYYIPHFLS